MKRLVALLLAVALVFAMTGCGKSKPVKEAEEAINQIGAVSLESKDQIEKAEKLYNILTDSEKSKVGNRLVLVEAREEYDKLKQADDEEREATRKKEIYDNAKLAYDNLNQVAQICADGMDDIYGAWYYGIYKVGKSGSYISLSMETPHLSYDELEAAAKVLGYSSSSMLTLGFSYSVFCVEQAYTSNGTYDKADELLQESLSLLQQLTDSYDDFTYYPKLKEYYSKASSYLEFFKSPTGSFEQLKDTINDYENSLRTYQTDVGFLFND